MFLRYDYYTEEMRFREEISRKVEEAASRETPEEKEAAAQKAREEVDKIIAESMSHNIKRCTIFNPIKAFDFLRFGEDLRKIARTVGGIVEIQIDERSWVGKLVYRGETILHTDDSFGDKTRFILAKILLAYEMVSFDPWEGGVQFTAITNLYDVAEIG